MGYNTVLISKRLNAILVVFFAILSLTLISCDDNDPQNKTTIKIGALFSLTGNWSTLGNTSRAALKIAIEDVNNYYKNNSRGVIFEEVIADTRLDPGLALDELREFSSDGIKYVIGPMSSSEVESVKNYADQNGIFILSQGSTASSLSIPGDNIFRFTPDDMLEGRAVVTLMQVNNASHVIPVWREDSGNTGLAESMRTIFPSTGGTVSQGISYSTVNPDFQAVVSSVEQQVTNAVSEHGTDGVVIYLAGFDEVAELFAAAGSSELLSSVKWYGTNGVVFSEALVQNTGGSSEFAQTVNYPSPIFGIDPELEPRWKPIADEIFDMTGLEPDAFALSVYDAVWVIANAYFSTSKPGNIENFIDSFVTEASLYGGITGSTELNDAGDRKIADFDFWGIRSQENTFIWKKLGFFDFDSGTVTVF